MEDAATINLDDAVQLISTLDDDRKYGIAFSLLRSLDTEDKPAKSESEPEEPEQRPLTGEEACRKITRILLDHDDFHDIIHAPQDAGLILDYLSDNDDLIRNDDVRNAIGRLGKRIYDGAKAWDQMYRKCFQLAREGGNNHPADYALEPRGANKPFWLQTLVKELKAAGHDPSLAQDVVGLDTSDGNDPKLSALLALCEKTGISLDRIFGDMPRARAG